MEKTNVIIGLVAVPQPTAQIMKVVADEHKKLVVVFFTDGAKEIVQCAKEDEFDVYVGVAIAEARHKYGSTGAFHRMVDGVVLNVKHKEKKSAPKKKPMPKAAQAVKKGSK